MASWSCVWSLTGFRTVEQDVRINQMMTTHQRDVQLEPWIFRHVGCVFARRGCITISHIRSFISFTAWLCCPLIPAGYLYHCWGFYIYARYYATIALIYILKTSDAQEQCVKTAFLCHINRLAPSSLHTHTHMITCAHTRSWLCTHTHTHLHAHRRGFWRFWRGRCICVNSFLWGDFPLAFFPWVLWAWAFFLSKLTVEFLSTSCMCLIYCLK